MRDILQRSNERVSFFILDLLGASIYPRNDESPQNTENDRGFRKANIECIKPALNAFNTQCKTCAIPLRSDTKQHLLCIKLYWQIDSASIHCFAGHLAISHQCITH